MRTAAKIIAVLAVVAGLAVGAIFAVSESGAEVVTVQTTRADSGTRSTRLWVVDDAGYAWLRAGMGRAAWVSQAEATGELVMTRQGETHRYRVVILEDEETRRRIHELFAAKYGWQDGFISMLRDGENSLAVRLERLES